jgi:hypothetical protein
VPADFNHALVGRAVVYRDPHASKPEQGVITSVNEEAMIIFVRFGSNGTSHSCCADPKHFLSERLTFLDGRKVTIK